MIAFSGLDGAGKTTQIDLLTQYYKKKEKKVEMLWSRGGYTPGMEKFKSILRSSKVSGIPEQRGRTKERSKSFSKSYIRKTWIFLAVLDLIYFYAIYIRWKELFGTVIICDRYIFDTEIDFQLNFPQEKVQNWLIWNLLKILAVKPKNHFVLVIPVSVSLERSKLKDEPFPDFEEVLSERLKRYLDYSQKNCNTQLIQCDDSIQAVHNIIIQKSQE